MTSTIEPMMITPHWALWVLLVLGVLGFWWVVARVVGALFGPDEETTDRDTGQRVDLDVQLAHGEIDVDEYQLRRRTWPMGVEPLSVSPQT
jgi:putative membrane protein